ICPPPAAPAARRSPRAGGGWLAAARAARAGGRRSFPPAGPRRGCPGGGPPRAVSLSCVPHRLRAQAGARIRVELEERALQFAGAGRAVIAPRHVAQELAHRLLALDAEHAVEGPRHAEV